MNNQIQKEIKLKHKNRWAKKSGNSDQFDRQKQTMVEQVEDKIFWKGKFLSQGETVKKKWKVIAMRCKSNEGR